MAPNELLQLPDAEMCQHRRTRLAEDEDFIDLREETQDFKQEIDERLHDLVDRLDGLAGEFLTLDNSQNHIWEVMIPINNKMVREMEQKLENRCIGIDERLEMLRTEVEENLKAVAEGVAKSLKATVDGVVANIKERSDGQDQIIDLIACEIGKDAKNKSDLMMEQARLGQRMEEQLVEAQEMMKSMQRNNQ